jgi:hypothetical protein
MWRPPLEGPAGTLELLGCGMEVQPSEALAFWKLRGSIHRGCSRRQVIIRVTSRSHFWGCAGGCHQ